MNNSWWQELMRFFLQGMTLKQLTHMLIILIVLIIVMPTRAKEWINLHNPEIIPPYWMYYTLLFCVSYVLNGAANSLHQAISSRSRALSERQAKAREEQSILDIFESLTLKEKYHLSCAVSANNILLTDEGDEAAIGLVVKGLLNYDGTRLGSDRKVKDKFSIPKKFHGQCYIRFARKLDDFIDELIEQERAGKLAVKGP